MIVTIDGPAGSGKSTVARELAARLGIAYLDTGAMYRALAWAALDRGVDITNERVVVDLARSMDLELDCGSGGTRVWIDGRDISQAIRTMAVSRATSVVARHQRIRELLVEKQQRSGERLGAFVTEGRDQGSIVFPDAEAKFVLEARLDERARRRLQEALDYDAGATIEPVMEDLRARDLVDAKQWQPLLGSGEALVIDSSALTVSQVADRIMEALGRIGGEGGRATSKDLGG